MNELVTSPPSVVVGLLGSVKHECTARVQWPVREDIRSVRPRADARYVDSSTIGNEGAETNGIGTAWVDAGGEPETILRTTSVKAAHRIRKKLTLM